MLKKKWENIKTRKNKKQIECVPEDKNFIVTSRIYYNGSGGIREELGYCKKCKRATEYHPYLGQSIHTNDIK